MGNDEWYNIWHLFMYNVLCGSHTPTFGDKYLFYMKYSAKTLWSLIPESLRHWWIDHIKTFNLHAKGDFDYDPCAWSDSECPYKDCTVSNPPSIFVDKTDDLKCFQADYDSGKLARIVEAMKNREVIDQRILCPFSCVTNCLDAGKVPFDVMAQQILPEIVLPVVHPQKMRLVSNSWTRYFRENVDDYPCVMVNKGWGVRPGVLVNGDGLHVLTCKSHNGGRDKLVLYPPISPHPHGILNCPMTDQLSHLVINPRVKRRVAVGTFNSTHSVVQCNSSFGGLDTCSLRVVGRFDSTSDLLYRSTSSAILGRSDIRALLSRKAANGEVSPMLEEQYLSNAKELYTIEHLRERSQGATYVRCDTMIRMHLHDTSTTKEVSVICERRTRLPGVQDWEERYVNRSWSPFINTLQTEDRSGYGTQVRPVPQLRCSTGGNEQTPTMMTWILFGILAGCPELWTIVDSKPTFRYDSWEGWAMTIVHQKCFGFDPVKVDTRSPFKKISLTALAKKINKIVLQRYTDHGFGTTQNEGMDFFQYSPECINCLFPGNLIHYTGSLAILATIANVGAFPQWYENKRVIIVAGSEAPVRRLETIGAKTFELRVVICVRSSALQGRPDRFEGVRYVSHGHGFDQFWKQEREDCISTKCPDMFEELRRSERKFRNNEYPFFQIVAVYAQPVDDDVERHKKKFSETMGVKGHVRCACTDFPLIPTPAGKKKKCNITCYFRENRNNISHTTCTGRQESYVCTNPSCHTRICRRCYNSFPDVLNGQAVVTTVVPPLVTGEDENETFDAAEEGSEDEDSAASDQGGDADNDSDNGSVESGGDSSDHCEDYSDFLISVDQDLTLNATHDSCNDDVGFYTTDAGDLPVDIRLRDGSEHISGHVIFNQAGACTTRRNNIISGTNRQKHFVQRLCSTSKGHPSPLLQPEGGIFPRHFYMNAQHDACSVLGARPLVLLTAKTYPHGYESTLITSRTRMTAADSTTGADLSYMNFLFDELGNRTMSKGVHSRDIRRRGFVVNEESSLGIDVRESGHTTLSQAVDSSKMVLKLGASMKYITWTGFYTLTLNQAMFPGVAHLNEWKRSMKWTECIPNWRDLSSSSQYDYRLAFEDVYGVQVFSNWNTVKKIFLHYIKEHVTQLGANMDAIFSRSEFQKGRDPVEGRTQGKKSVGNFEHEHLIFHIKDLNEDVEQYLDKLISTSVIELIKTSDLQNMIDEGILKSVDEVYEKVELAGRILPHICGPTCWKRVGPGDGQENFVCRKIHPWKGNPDPTSYYYKPINHKYDTALLTILRDIGICLTDEHGNDTFTHGYFQPYRVLPPCNRNALCHMSPVPSQIFSAFGSMMNIQFLGAGQNNGNCKYTAKYVAKHDKGNRVKAHADAHTGDITLEKTHLHNTKIGTSARNEKLAEDSRRDKHHDTGFDMITWEIRKLLMGQPDVYTNLHWEDVPTEPLEVRKGNRIKLDRSGAIIVPDAFSSNIPMEQARANLPECQRMTEDQVATFRNHNGDSAKYDNTSIFSLRPLELLDIFSNPIEYFRFCYIEPISMSANFAITHLHAYDSTEFFCCRWIDQFGRQVKIRSLAFCDELRLLLVQKQNLVIGDTPVDELTPRQIMFDKVVTMLNVLDGDSETSHEGLPEYWLQDMRKHFVYQDPKELLPIPVVTPTVPWNAHKFIQHILISLGYFDTEIGMMTQSSIRECFRAARLIGRDSDTRESYLRDVNNLMKRYVLEQVVYLTNSVKSTGRMMVAAKNVFTDAILHNELTMDGLPSCQMSAIFEQRITEHMQYWPQKKASQLDSCYSELANISGIPEREEVERATRERIFEWDPVESLVRSENQSIESFNEQKLALKLVKSQVDKYRNAESLTCAKNPLISGKPGAGKTFVAQISVLYCVACGLNVMTTALQAARAAILGGIHVHQFFQQPATETSHNPYKIAQKAMEKLASKPEAQFALKTIDALLIDESEQISNEQLGAIDIIFRKQRESENPFGGVLILGAMDPCQLHPINQLPFLTSSLILTNFVMVQLRNSVRAHGQTDFERLQDITRMSAGILLTDPNIKDEFVRLASNILMFADDWDDDKINAGMLRAYPRKVRVNDALTKYIRTLRTKLERDNIPFRTVRSVDTQKTDGSSAEWSPATQASRAKLNKELREQPEILLARGATYELTQNDREGNFCQSNIVLLLDLPSTETLRDFRAFPVWVAPPGCQRIDYNENNVPTREELISRNWREVSIGVAAQRPVRVRGGILAQRIQYALKHIGAITIDRTLGLTLPAGIAVEISSNFSPWNKEQIVVVLSRTHVPEMTVIVGGKEFAIQKMWELITCANQWTKYMDRVTNVISINTNDDDVRVFDVPRVYPFKVLHYGLPTDNSGYVYCLVSKRDHGEIYIGTAVNISERLPQHNSNSGGSLGTADPSLKPWAMASYICGLSHMNTGERMSMEREWKRLVEQNGSLTTFQWINFGQNLVNNYNAEAPMGNRINFVRTIEPATLSR